jgi:multidrug resistance efflux pump
MTAISAPKSRPNCTVRYCTRCSLSRMATRGAAVQRYIELQGFHKIIAPFPGVITARSVDAGDLISADSPSSTRELFHLMRTDVLRVFVNVPQVFATGITVGQRAAGYLRATIPPGSFPAP